MKKVIILCTGNSCRSQMAEALWNDLGAGEWAADSAGSNPSGFVHRLAIKAIAEVGLDIASNRSQSIGDFRDESYDLAVTVCDNARDACPVFPNATETLHWPFEDPARATGDEAHQMEVFRRIRDEIRKKISKYLGV